MILERAQRLLSLALEADQRKHGDREAQLGRIEIGVITLNDACFFETAHAPQARRRGQSDALGEFHVGDPSFGLEFGEQATVNFVEIDHSNSPAGLSLSLRCNIHIENTASL